MADTYKTLISVGTVTSLDDTDYIVVNDGDTVKQVTKGNLLDEVTTSVSENAINIATNTTNISNFADELTSFESAFDFSLVTNEQYDVEYLSHAHLVSQIDNVASYSATTASNVYLATQDLTSGHTYLAVIDVTKTNDNYLQLTFNCCQSNYTSVITTSAVSSAITKTFSNADTDTTVRIGWLLTASQDYTGVYLYYWSNSSSIGATYELSNFIFADVTELTSDQILEVANSDYFDTTTFTYVTADALSSDASASFVSAIEDVLGDSPTVAKSSSSVTINSTSGRTVNATFAATNGIGFKITMSDLTVGNRLAIWMLTDVESTFRAYLQYSGSWVQYAIMTYVPNIGYYIAMDIEATNDGYLYILDMTTTAGTSNYTFYVFDVTDNAELEAFVQQDIGYKLIGMQNTALNDFGDFFGKKLVFMGDSNTANKKYQAHAVRRLGIIDYESSGISGTNVAGGGTTAFWQDVRVNALADDADIIFIMGGTNDSANSRSIGTVSTDNYDTTTFVGAYNVLLTKIYYRYALASAYYSSIDYTGVTQLDTAVDIKIFIATPPFSSDSTYQNDGLLLDICDAVKSIGQMWGIPVIDVYGNSQLNYTNADTYYSDGIHVNNYGGQKIGNTIGNLMKVYK